MWGRTLRRRGGCVGEEKGSLFLRVICIVRAPRSSFRCEFRAAPVPDPSDFSFLLRIAASTTVSDGTRACAAPVCLPDSGSACAFFDDLIFVKALSMSFESLHFDPAILRALTAAGHHEPTPVQARAIPEATVGHDLMVSAPTGTGKTAAYVLPALQRLIQPSARPGAGPRVLVLTPTRELALQVTGAVEQYGKFMHRIRSGAVLGGMPYPRQRRLLAQPLDILVATPGRLIDFMERGGIDFSRLELLVLDEADRMLDMGFIGPVERIAA